MANTKIRVAIIGGGVSGLATAAFLRKYAQYSVNVYERRPADFKETSAAFGIRASGISIIAQLGIGKDEVDATVGAGYRTYNAQEELMSKSVVGESELWFMFRQDLKDALFRRVTDPKGGGEPIGVKYGSHIVRVDSDQGFLHFEDGKSVEVDLIIGADGIHSKTRASVIPPSHPQPVPCGLSLYRFMVPIDVFEETMKAEGGVPPMFNYNEGMFVAIIAAGDEGNRNAVMYSCRNGRFMNVACAVPDSMLKNQANLEYSWNAVGSVDELVDNVEGFPGWMGRLFGRMSRVELFQVRDQEPLPMYFRGRTVLIGDAAHPMVPYQGQGTNQCLEAVEGLVELLRDVVDVGVILERLRVWDSIRRPRALTIQRSARFSQAQISSRQAVQNILAVSPYVTMREALAQRSVVPNPDAWTLPGHSSGAGDRSAAHTGWTSKLG